MIDMKKEDISEKMLLELEHKVLFEAARKSAFEYIDQVKEMDVFPSEKSLSLLESLDEDLPVTPSSGVEIVELLKEVGSQNTIAQTGGRYFGFVNGNAIPASLAAKWLSDVWDQAGSFFVSSPINAKLEEVCEGWMREIFGLPEQTVAGFVSGTSMANLSGLAAARFHILEKQGWDLNHQGFNGAPPIRVITHQETHASVKKTAAILGFGIDNLEVVPSDEQGRIIVDAMPELDETCLVVLQAGNVNTGSFDDFDAACDIANEAGAWVHVDGAFGLWAAASKELAYLTKGIEKATSWAVDGHKTLNTPYDCGIVLCSNPDAIRSALLTTGDYLVYRKEREPIMFTPEMSKRSRAIEFWAAMKFLGREGMDQMILGFHQHSQRFATGFERIGFELLNEVVFNQTLIRAETDEKTKAIIKHVQESGVAWVGGTQWQGRESIRISVCSWATTEDDVDRTLGVFEDAWKRT